MTKLLLSRCSSVRRVQTIERRGGRCCAASAPPEVSVSGVASVQGTVRVRNEDRFDMRVGDPASDGSISAFVGVYDGHGGTATSNWLEKNLFDIVEENWPAKKGDKAIMAAVNKAFREADSQLLSPGGWMGMGERGIGGSKCGSTAALACVFVDKDGEGKLLSANVGDARVIVSRGGKAVQLSIDHVPDNEDERKRIEAQNPNPRMPLVRFVGETWRVGGLLALSRAFGDAYMKGSLQFEGVVAGSDGYSSGFGVTAEPDQDVIALKPDDSWVIVCSDGLFANEERGGGSGLTNQQIVDVCEGAGSADPQKVADELCSAAQAAGSTDDVTVALLKLR